MSTATSDIFPLDLNATPGRPLAPWTYTNAELLELEYATLFLRRWQFVGHINDVPGAGDYITSDIGRDSVVVLRDKEGELRAFLNVCRHRASRIFTDQGNCRGVARCPYHGWTYRLDGTLMAIPQQENFPDFDRETHGLHQLQLDVFHGFLFVRVTGAGPGVAEQFGDMAHFFEDYDVANYVRCAETTTQVWDVNWKVAWDNYQENYHIPIGHPGLHRLVVENDDSAELSSGVNYGIFEMRDKPSRIAAERRYQEQFHCSEHRVPNELKGKWVQLGMSPNLGIDLYPEMLDLFQLVPLSVGKTLVRAIYYGPANPDADEIELRRLNIEVNDPINEEDKLLCTRVQQGLSSFAYRPGPLSQQEISVFYFHEFMRSLLPVSKLETAPQSGTVASENQRLSAQS